MTYFDYLNGDSEQEVVSVTDYYYLDPDGTPYLLARAMGDDRRSSIWTVTGAMSCARPLRTAPNCSSAGRVGSTRRTSGR